MPDGRRESRDARAGTTEYAEEDSLAVERKHRADEIQRIGVAIHELCQPLTALQFRLEIGKMTGTSEGYEEAVLESLAEYDRLFSSVMVLREMVGRAMDAAEA